jgi:short-chain 2-methylacyl-CoA dehydrogenase
VRDGDEWVIDGAKAFITNSGTDITSVVTVTARTGTKADGSPEISAIMVPAGTPGFIVEPAYHKLGWHVSDTHGLTFSGCRVPADNLLGEPGEGFKQFLKTLDDGRIAISALAVGCAQACLELATDYAKTRIAFGRPIGVNQGVSFQLADLAVMLEGARLLTYKAAWLKDELHQGRRSVAEVKQAAAIAKLHSTEAAVTATRIATQVFGGNGFMEEYPVARFYRDAKILEIGEGTSEVQRMLIARGLGLPA